MPKKKHPTKEEKFKTDAKRNWPSIEYNGWQKIYEEKIFTEDQKMWAFSITNQQNDNTSSQPLRPKTSFSYLKF